MSLATVLEIGDAPEIVGLYRFEGLYVVIRWGGGPWIRFLRITPDTREAARLFTVWTPRQRFSAPRGRTS